MIVVGAGVIVREDGRILLTQRGKGHLEGLWEFPGGKVEEGEDPRDTVVRECLEECAIEVRVGEILDVTFHRYPSKTVLLLFYRCELVAGEVQHLQVADHAWVQVDQLDSYAMPPADEPVLAKISEVFGGANE